MGKQYQKLIYAIGACFVFLLMLTLFFVPAFFSCVLTAVREELLPGICVKESESRLIGEFFPFFVCEGEPENICGESISKQYTPIPADGENGQGENTGGADLSLSASASDAPYLTAEEEDGLPAVQETMGPVASGGIRYSPEQLASYDFLTGNCFNISASTVVYPDELDAARILSTDMHIDLSGDGYKVLIYHTHGSEGYTDSRQGVAEDTVVGVGDELARILTETYGVKVYHDRTAYDTVDGTLNRDRAYELSAQAIDRILAENPSIEMMIDVHRDGVRDDLRLMRVVDGKPCAQLMFVNGMSRSALQGEVAYLSNPYREENLAFGFALHIEGKALYGDLMRRNYISGYRYNMHKMPKAALVEVGAQTNTVAEAKNAMEPLAEIIYNVIAGE